ncbi:MAG: menaquinol oxidoreductase [Gemmatimonadetes bacterium]|nr:menaquinol oxidoreductase [Gemmatimonadota bacterium]MDA1102226.1 menaquinol oxidoreductase [Gemmatimonadota bacterium]
MKKHWLIGGLAGVFALAGLAFVQGGGAEGEAATAAASGQPIAFPHNQHAGNEPGQNNMDCQFCHFSAERSVDAGIPPVSTCWGCHQIVQGTTAAQQQEIAKIGGYVERGEPIPWVRMYKISDHAHFPHMRHINAGLECQQCHGEVQTMTEITTRTGLARVFIGADPVWGGDNMGWCVECHRQPDPATGEQQASTDCAVCHY